MNYKEKQNRINEYYNKLYGNKLYEDEERKIGSIKDIKNKLKEEIKELEEKREDDIVEIFEHNLSAYYVTLNQDSLYEELKIEYV